MLPTTRTFGPSINLFYKKVVKKLLTNDVNGKIHSPVLLFRLSNTKTEVSVRSRLSVFYMFFGHHMCACLFMCSLTTIHEIFFILYYYSMCRHTTTSILRFVQ